MMMYVDKFELAKMFNIPVSTVDYYRRNKTIPALQLGKGRNYRYDPKEVERALKANNN